MVLKRAFKVLTQEGIGAVLERIWLRFWPTLCQFLPAPHLPAETISLDYRPLISVAIPVYNVETYILYACIDSVLNQRYENWQLCLVDDCSSMPEMAEILMEYAARDDRIRIALRQKNGHIAKATNDAIALCEGEFIAFMDCDDVLHPDALYEVALLLNKNPQMDFIYTDEDKLSEDGKKRYEPFFKPDWSPDTLLSMMYTGHLGIYRTSLVREVGGIHEGVNGSQDYDFTLRFTECTNRIGHVPRVLYHWRVRGESVAASPLAKPYAYDAADKAKKDALRRRGIAGKTQQVEGMTHQRICYDVTGEPLVSIVITKISNAKNIEENTGYPHVQWIYLEKGQRKIAAAHQVNGEYVVFVNDDLMPKASDWVEKMLSQAQQTHTGAVGTKILHRKKPWIVHQGLTGAKKGLGALLFRRTNDFVYYAGWNRVDVNCLAVTSSLMMVETKKWREAGLFDETLPEEALCLKLYAMGYFNCLRNDVVFTSGKLPLYIGDRAALEKAYPMLMKNDPFYNPNLYKIWGDFSFIAPRKYL